MINPSLKITDGTAEGTVDLISMRGWSLKEWKPSVPEPKGGGVFRDSPLVDGRKLAYRKMGNTTDTLNLVGNADNQDAMITTIQKLQRLLEKATSYWTSGWQGEPVWMEVRASNETGTRYATIVDYRLTGFGGPFEQPFFSSNCSSATEAILVIEHYAWQDTKPGEDGVCVELSNNSDWPNISTITTDTYTPTASDHDAVWSSIAWRAELTTAMNQVGYGWTIPGKGETGIIFPDITIDPWAKISNATLTVRPATTSSTNELIIFTKGQQLENGYIKSTNITNGGTGYNYPVVTVSDPTGSHAVITATQEGGVVTGLNILDGGRNYTNPTITITDRPKFSTPPGSGGSGATATATAASVNAIDDFDGTVEDYKFRTKAHRWHFYIDHGWTQDQDVTFDVTSIVQEIIGDRDFYPEENHWSNPNRICLFLSCADGSITGRRFWSWDEFDVTPGNLPPRLSITYATDDVTVGRDATCLQEVMVANKYNNSFITHVYWQDNSEIGGGGEWSNNLLAETLPVYLLPYTPPGVRPDVGDRVYFGSETDSGGVYEESGGVFNNLVFDILETMEGINEAWDYHDAVNWLYWNGASWAAFTIDNTNSNLNLSGDEVLFGKRGVGSIVFEPPADWDTTEVNGITGYWICMEIESVSALVDAVAPSQQKRSIYTAIRPYVDIDSDQIPGDIPALSRIKFEASNVEYHSMNTIIVGLRSLSRGREFCAYLNASDTQSINGIGFSYNTDESVSLYSVYPNSPTGTIIDTTGMTTNDVMTNICIWTISGELAKQYIGIYHAFVRCKISANPNVLKFRLRSVFGEEYNISYSDTTASTLGALSSNIATIDLGQFSILPTNSMKIGDDVQNIRIYLDTQSSDDTVYSNGAVFDVVLMPADEWSGNFGIPKISGLSVLSNGAGIDIDAITNPRQYRAVQYDTRAYGFKGTRNQHIITADWSRIASSEPVFQANADQRVWFLQYKFGNWNATYFENCGLVSAERSARYILARGVG